MPDSGRARFGPSLWLLPYAFLIQVAEAVEVAVAEVAEAEVAKAVETVEGVAIRHTGSCRR